jgi:hypothetical protein
MARIVEGREKLAKPALGMTNTNKPLYFIGGR